MMSSILASSLCFRTTLLILQCIKTFCSPESSAEKEEKHYGGYYDFHMCFVELAFKGVLCTHLGDKRPLNHGYSRLIALIMVKQPSAARMI